MLETTKWAPQHNNHPQLSLSIKLRKSPNSIMQITKQYFLCFFPPSFFYHPPKFWTGDLDCAKLVRSLWIVRTNASDSVGAIADASEPRDIGARTRSELRSEWVQYASWTRNEDEKGRQILWDVREALNVLGRILDTAGIFFSFSFSCRKC